MIKSIATSPESKICKESKIQRDFSTVLKNTAAMDREINRRIQKYEDRQTLSKCNATQIRSR